MTPCRRPAGPARPGTSGVLLGLALVLGCSGTEAVTGALDPRADGRLVVEVVGLGHGVAAAVTVSGPDGFQRVVTGTDTLASLGQPVGSVSLTYSDGVRSRRENRTLR